MCIWATVFSFLQGLCSWAINIIGFYEVYCDVEPKRKALAAANAELAAAQEKLAKIKAKIQVCSKMVILPTIGIEISNNNNSLGTG